MRNRYVLLADLPVFVVAAFLAFALRFDLRFFPHRAEFVPFVAAALVLKPLTLLSFGMYKRYWRYATLNDMLALVLAVAAASAALAVSVGVAVGLGYLPFFSRAVLLVDALLTFVGVAGIRVAVRVIGEAQERTRAAGDGRRRRVLIAGAGEAGVMIVREIRRNPHLGLSVVGFVDDAPEKIGKRIQGVPVLGDTRGAAQIVKRLNVEELIVAMPKAGGATVRAVAEACRRAGVTSRIMPGVFELLDGHVSVSRLRQLDIADLLRRSEIRPDAEAGKYLRQRRVLVTGAGGSIGYELCRQIARAQPSSLMLVGHGENSIFEAHAQLAEKFPSVKFEVAICDIRDARRISTIASGFCPEVLFHAAAHKHVPLMEANPEEAVSNNVFGTQNVVDAALTAGVERFVLISTDKAVAPSSLMGASKRLAELIVRRAAREHRRRFSVVRFGNVLGSRGSVVPHFKRQVELGGPVTVTHPEMTRFFMTIPEAVYLVLQAGGLATGGELFVLSMGSPIRIVDLARDIIQLSGFTEEEIGIRFSGIRPGEKLHEMLWESDAAVAPTRHPDVLIVDEKDEGSASLDAALQALRHAAAGGDRASIEAAIASVVPTFQASWMRDAGSSLSVTARISPTPAGPFS